MRTRREALADGALAGLWLTAALAQAQGAHPLDRGLALQSGLIAWRFVTRCDATVQAGRGAHLLAAGTTVLPMVALRATGGGAELPAAVIEGAALVWLLWSLWALGDAFGVGPALRGIVCRGPYAIVRHPLYAGSIAYGIGYLLGNPSAANAAVLAVLVFLQIVRAWQEEALLARSDEYRTYMRRVPGAFWPCSVQAAQGEPA